MQQNRKTSIFDTLRSLLQPKNMAASIDSTKKYNNIAAYAILRGVVEAGEVGKSLLKIHERKMIRFAPWSPAGLFVNVIKKPRQNVDQQLSGLLISNTAAIIDVSTCFTSIRSLKEQVNNTTDCGKEMPFWTCIGEKACLVRIWKNLIPRGNDSHQIYIIRESLHDLVTSYEMYNDSDLKTILK